MSGRPVPAPAGAPAAAGPAWRLALLLLLLTVPAWAPLLAPGYFFNAHDAHHSVFYLVEFDQAIREGVLWPRWGPDHAMGYGYPLWIVYAPLAYYVAEAFHLLGLGLTAAVKASWLLAFLVSALGMFQLARRWWGDTAGLIAGLLYTYMPYHLVNIYVRAAYAEFWGMAWFPWVLLAFERLLERPSRRRLALAAAAYAGVMLTHTVMIPLFTPWLMAFILVRLAARGVRARRLGLPGTLPRGLLAAAAAGLLGISLAAIFLVPLAAEQRFMGSSWTANTYEVGRNFVYFFQLFSPFWGFGYSVAGPLDGMAFQLGLVPLLLAAAGALWGLRGHVRERSLIAFLVLLSALSGLATLGLSAPLWDRLPLVNLLQFPWRLFSLTTLSLALLGAAAAAAARAAAAGHGEAAPAAAPVLVYPLALLIVAASFPYTRPQFTPVTPRDESPLAIIDFETAHPDMIGTMTATQQRFEETPLLSQYLAAEPLQRATIVQGTGRVSRETSGAQRRSFQVTAETPLRIVYDTYNFPGWQVTLDGAALAVETVPPYGLIGFEVPAGTHQVEVRMGSTPDRRLGVLISLAALLVTLLLLLPHRIHLPFRRAML